MNPWPVRGRRRGGPPAAARPRRPGRDPEVRADRRPRHPRARQRPRDRRARRRRRRGQGVPARARGRGVLARDPDHRRQRRAPRRPDARGLRRRRRVAGPLPGPRRPARRWSPRSTVCARRTSRSAACSRCGRSGSCPGSDRTSPGRSGSTGVSARRSCRSRRSRRSRSATASRWPACPDRRPTTRSSTTRSAATTARRNRAGGVEGGMTTGAPLVVRGSMKPLPTLTKPLRSVDIATHEPAEALRERTDSCTVPAAGVVGEAMVAFVLADAYRQQVRRRPHRRRPRAPCTRTRSGSDGGAAEARSGADGTDRPGAARRLHRVHGRGQVDGRAQRGGGAGGRGGRRRRRDRGAPGKAHRARSSPRTARPRSGRPRSASRSSCSAIRRRALSPWAAVPSGHASVREALADHLVVWLDIALDDAWDRCGGSCAPAGARPRAVRSPLRRARAAVRGSGRRDRARPRARTRWEACSRRSRTFPPAPGCCGLRARPATIRPTSAPAS